jgi:hypothetical protein
MNPLATLITFQTVGELQDLTASYWPYFVFELYEYVILNRYIGGWTLDGPSF